MVNLSTPTISTPQTSQHARHTLFCSISIKCKIEVLGSYSGPVAPQNQLACGVKQSGTRSYLHPGCNSSGEEADRQQYGEDPYLREGWREDIDGPRVAKWCRGMFQHSGNKYQTTYDVQVITGTASNVNDLSGSKAARFDGLNEFPAIQL